MDGCLRGAIGRVWELPAGSGTVRRGYGCAMTDGSVHADLTRRLAELVGTAGANVQPGQIVAIGSETGKEDLTRAIAAAAYRAGAKFVDVGYFDPWVKRARVEHAEESTLDFVPDWYGARVLALGDE